MENSESNNVVRKSDRYPVDVRIKLSYSKDGFLQRADARALDIGPNGIAVNSPLHLPVDAAVELDITLPGSRVPLRVKAMIRNRKGFRYGVEFLSITDSQRKDIAKFGTARKPSGTAPADDDSALPAAN
jgi:hypothetical protein